MKVQQRIIMPYRWQNLPGGNEYQQALQAQLDSWWPKITGLQLLKWGELSGDLVCANSQFYHQIIFPLFVQEGESLLLPYHNDSFDACLLAHTLCYSTYPHEILREADRVLTDKGWLLVSGFNAMSLLGISRWVPQWGCQSVYQCRLFNMWRVLDWLLLLNYEIICCRTFQVMPGGKLSGINKVLERCFPFFGCQYVIIARKRTIPLQPIHGLFPLYA